MIRSIPFFKSFNTILVLATVLRVILLIYSEYQDANYEVKYTDIDYEVFTDAARYVSQGKSPYLRSTYRYTPLLAIILTPNIWVHKSFGKLIFSFADLLVGLILKKLCLLRNVEKNVANKIIAFGWLLNPLVANISTRGNAESLLLLIILASLHAFLINNFILGCVLYGLSVHFKIYPIIYAIPLLFFFNHHHPRQRNLLKQQGKRPVQTQYASSDHSASSTFITAFCSNVFNWLYSFFESFLPIDIFNFFTQTRFELAAYSGATFILLNVLMYLIYGHEFLEHTYLYHVTRKDHRHNFSIWFYPIYLSATSTYFSDKFIGIASFLPQFFLTGYLGWAYGLDLFFACFLQTFAFVALNKVCTSQYFMWYIGFIPLVLTSSEMRLRWEGAKVLGLWVLGQAVWLFPAYLLEFKGTNTFIWIWLGSLVFFSINCYILILLLKAHRFQPIFYHGRIMPFRNAKINPLKNKS